MPDDAPSSAQEFPFDERALCGVQFPAERSGVISRALAWLRAARRRPTQTIEPYDGDADDE